jgi:2-keto-4-pentenoate hydratase/2-oxohepta-3-ene-1,7-dioic acid hydratase in catechol pathway
LGATASRPIRLATVEHDGRERIALVLDGGLRLLDGVPPQMRELVAAWNRYAPIVESAAQSQGALLAPRDVQWCPPLTPRKLLCVGANYYDHVAEMDGPAGLSTPPAPFPYSFLKPPTALIGSGRDVPYPAYGHKLDWEAELAVVIGDGAAALGDDPLAAVFGYTILNDLSLRDFLPFPHALGLDAVASKGFDGAAPIGPWIRRATPGEDIGSLGIQLLVNGELMQDSSTANMIFSVGELISHFGRVLTLEPGDVIATGTPAGVGAGRTPPRYLRPGERIEARIDGLGSLETTITAPQRAISLSAERAGKT